MKTLLPPESEIRVTARPQEPGESTLARADAAVLLVDQALPAARTLAALPLGARLKSLHAAEVRNGHEAPIVCVRMANRRQTLLVVGFVKPGASAFERLTVAGKLAREVLRPGVEKLQLHYVGGKQDQTAKTTALEALLSAVLAHAAPMPEWKSKPTVPHELQSIEVASQPSPHYDAAIAIAAGNHLARWLAALPPNRLDTHGYRQTLQQIARREGWTFQFYDEAALEKLGAGAFLAV